MIEFEEASVSKLTFHRVSVESHKSVLGTTEYDFSEREEESEVLRKIFLKPFTNTTSTYEFKHDIGLELNTLFKLAKDIRAEESFLLKSHDIHQHLTSVSKHPNIKDGDLFVVQFDDVKLNNAYYQALGVYKIENKETFIETSSDDDGDLGVALKKGIGTRKLDKACLILFAEEPYIVFVIDNGSTETDYWINEFVNVDYRNDYVNSTNQFMNLTKSFITEQIPNEYEVSKADQIDLLNRSVEYFKQHDTFEKEEFEKEVFQESAVIDSFRAFDETYSQEHNVEVVDNFEISEQAVKKQARVFKSVLKLDKNFHVYIHGDKSLIEQGVEPDGRKFYKIYYEEES